MMSKWFRITSTDYFIFQGFLRGSWPPTMSVGKPECGGLPSGLPRETSDTISHTSQELKFDGPALDQINEKFIYYALQVTVFMKYSPKFD